MTTPLARLIGDRTSPPPTECRILAKDVAVHWYPANSKPGALCFCGNRTLERDTGCPDCHAGCGCPTEETP